MEILLTRLCWRSGSSTLMSFQLGFFSGNQRCASAVSRTGLGCLEGSLALLFSCVGMWVSSVGRARCTWNLCWWTGPKINLDLLGDKADKPSFGIPALPFHTPQRASSQRSVELTSAVTAYRRDYCIIFSCQEWRNFCERCLELFWFHTSNSQNHKQETHGCSDKHRSKEK